MKTVVTMTFAKNHIKEVALEEIKQAFADNGMQLVPIALPDAIFGGHTPRFEHHNVGAIVAQMGETLTP